MAGIPGIADTPSDKAATERLMRYWAEGEGALKWVTSPTPFRTLRLHLAKFVPPRQLDGLTANLYHRVFGVWPGGHKKKSEQKRIESSAEVLAKRLKPGKK